MYIKKTVRFERRCRVKEEEILNLIFLTQQGGILGPFAWIMGEILNAIYEIVSLLGIHNIAICIILFTFVMKMLMLPLTIKQQKFSKLSSKMNPELTKINAKYKNKKDPESVKKMQAETQEVYARYGANPMSGCLPLLITLPIMFALYRVIYAVPAYINDINLLYDVVADKVTGIAGYTDVVKEFVSANSIQVSISKFTEEQYTITHLIDIFSKFNPVNWDSFLNLNEFFSNIVPANEVWEAFLNKNEFEALAAMSVSLDGSLLSVGEVVEQIKGAHSFLFGMNILETAGWGLPGITIPIISMCLYFVQNKLMTANSNTNNDVDNPAAQSMKTMNTVMPIVSGLFCVFMPIGVGIYWIASSLFQIAQQFFINRYMDRIDIDDMIEKNVEKSNLRNKKYGIDTGSKMASVAKTTTKAIETTATTSSAKKKPVDVSNYKKSDVSYSAGSISANANIMKDRNKDKGDK